EASADFAATVHGIPKEDLLSEEVRQQRRALTLAWSAVVALILFSGFAGWQWFVAEAAKKVAIAQQRTAITQQSRLLARIALEQYQESPARSYLIAAQTVQWHNDDVTRNRPDIPEARYALNLAASALIDTPISIQEKIYVLELSTKSFVIALVLEPG